MIWQDVVAQHSLSDREIVEGLAAAFEVEDTQVVVCRSEEDFPEPGNSKVVCLVSERSKGFRLVLSIYTYFLDSQPYPNVVVKKIAKLTCSDVLISDGSINPYTMIRLTPDGGSARVFLDAQRLDDEGEYDVRL